MAVPASIVRFPPPSRPAEPVGPGLPAELVISAELSRIARATVERGLVSQVYQPIVDVSNGRVRGYEALLRTRVPAFAGPAELFRAAAAAGVVGELGRLSRTLAIRDAPDATLFLNVFPNEFDHAFLVRADDPIFKHRKQVYLEVTESVPLQYFAQCRNVLAEVRKKGVKLAIDDLGSGYSNLKYIADLGPDIVKLDRGLVAGIRSGTIQDRLLKSIVVLCHDVGAEVVAEGVETRDELSAVLDAEVDMVQGYLLARPAMPLPEVAWPGDPA